MCIQRQCIATKYDGQLSSVVIVNYFVSEVCYKVILYSAKNFSKVLIMIITAIPCYTHAHTYFIVGLHGAGFLHAGPNF